MLKNGSGTARAVRFRTHSPSETGLLVLLRYELERSRIQPPTEELLQESMKDRVIAPSVWDSCNGTAFSHNNGRDQDVALRAFVRHPFHFQSN